MCRWNETAVLVEMTLELDHGRLALASRHGHPDHVQRPFQW